MTPESFKKGQAFEDYVEKYIFPVSHYTLISRTSSYDQNAKRFAEDTLKPDFKFKCNRTGMEFYVEAKFRSSVQNDMLKGLARYQINRFRDLENTEGIPVFIIIGFFGSADHPTKLCLIPLSQYEHEWMYASVVRKHMIQHGPCPNQYLIQFSLDSRGNNSTDSYPHPNPNFNYNPKKKGTEPIDTTRKNTTIGDSEPQPKENKKPTLKTKVDKKTKFAAIIGVLAIFLAIYAFSFSSSETASPEERLREVISDYYNTMNSNNVTRLPDFLSLEVTNWYGDVDPEREEIIQAAIKHRGTYPFSESEINWDSFKVMARTTGDYFVSYDMIYRQKKKITDEYKEYDLNLLTEWDENFKLKSIREIKN